MNLKIEVSIGEFRDVWEIDGELLGEERKRELQQKLALVPASVNFLARRAGLRPSEDARMAMVAAFNRAVEVGDDAEAARLLSALEAK